MRAAAFAHGMTEALRSHGGGANGLLDQVRLVSGVSGGSVTAAQLGLNGPEGLRDYCAQFLLRIGKRYMATNAFNPLTLARGIAGGADGRATFGRHPDEVLLRGATFGDLHRRGRIETWINAADTAGAAPSIFVPETFDAQCSDLSRLPVSEAAAASAAARSRRSATDPAPRTQSDGFSRPRSRGGKAAGPGLGRARCARAPGTTTGWDSRKHGRFGRVMFLSRAKAQCKAGPVGCRSGRGIGGTHTCIRPDRQRDPGASRRRRACPAVPWRGTRSRQEVGTANCGPTQATQTRAAWVRASRTRAERSDRAPWDTPCSII